MNSRQFAVHFFFICSFKSITWEAALRVGQENIVEFACIIRISPSLSCNTEFPFIMFLSMLLAGPVENAWKCGTNVIVFPWPWEKRLMSRTGQLYWGYSWPVIDFDVYGFQSLLAVVWSSVKSWAVCNREAPHSKICISVRTAVPHSCEPTWGRRAEVIDWKGKKVKVRT